MTTLVIAEHNNEVLSRATYKAVTAASQLEDSIELLVLGSECQAVVTEACLIDGVSKVRYVDDKSLAHLLAEAICPLLVDLATDYQAIIAPSGTFAKNCLPRMAAMLDMAQVSDVVAIQSADTFVRPIYAGNVMQTVQALDPIKILTIRPTAFEAALSQASACPSEALPFAATNTLTTFIQRDVANSERPELSDASIVVSGGRALQSKEKFELIEELADKLKAAVGASRAAVDAGFVANEYQVGQTGKVVAPELYIAIGISGAVQHLAGMKDAKIIVAINKDEDAPIFQIATYGLVGDLFEIVPELITKL